MTLSLNLCCMNVNKPNKQRQTYTNRQTNRLTSGLYLIEYILDNQRELCHVLVGVKLETKPDSSQIHLQAFFWHGFDSHNVWCAGFHHKLCVGLKQFKTNSTQPQICRSKTLVYDAIIYITEQGPISAASKHAKKLRTTKICLQNKVTSNKIQCHMYYVWLVFCLFLLSSNSFFFAFKKLYETGTWNKGEFTRLQGWSVNLLKMVSMSGRGGWKHWT